MRITWRIERMIWWLLAAVLLASISAFVGCIVSHHNLYLDRAQLGCQSISRAVEAYVDHPANKTHELPNTLHALVEPLFCDRSFLRNGEADLFDPWGKHYQMERLKR